MDERNGIEQQPAEDRQSTIKKHKHEKHTSRTESRFKSKLEFFKKFPHSVLSNSAVEKARALFRSSDHKRHDSNNNHDQQLSVSSPLTSPHPDTDATTPAVLVNTNTVDDGVPTANILLNPITPVTHISTVNAVRVDKINPKDSTTDKSIPTHRADYKLSSNYFHHKYKQYLKPSLLLPKQYYNEILCKHDYNYFTSIHRRDLRTRPSVARLTPNLACSSRSQRPLNISTSYRQAFPCDAISASLYNHQPYPYRQITSSSDTPYYSLTDSIIQPLPSSSSMLAWNQCVRRLNTEYKLTILALQQAKECLENVYSNRTKSFSKYANMMARDIKSFSNSERKKTNTVTFCLPLSSSERDCAPAVAQRRIEPYTVLPPVVFSKPKLIKPVELGRFSPSSKFHSPLAINEKDEHLDSIDNIIKKINDLNGSLLMNNIVESPPIPPSPDFISATVDDPNVRLKPLNIDNDLQEVANSFTIPSPQETTRHQSGEGSLEEETTYTIETFYHPADNSETNSLFGQQGVIVIEENSNEEQFNLINEQQHREAETKQISSEHQLTINAPEPQLCFNPPEALLSNENSAPVEISSKSIINNTKSNPTASSTLSNGQHKTNSSSATRKTTNNNKLLPQVPKRPTTIATSKLHSEPSSKHVPSFNKLKSSTPTIVHNAMTPIRRSSKTVTNSSPTPVSTSIKKPTVTNSNHSNIPQNKTNTTSSTGKNRVKSIVNQLNATASMSAPSSVKTGKRTFISSQSTTSNGRSTTQQK